MTTKPETNTSFIIGYAQEFVRDGELAPEHQADIAGFVGEIEDFSERTQALRSLREMVDRPREDLQRLLERNADRRFGHGLAEIGEGTELCMDDLKLGFDRLLAGKNTGLVVRAGATTEQLEEGQEPIDLLEQPLISDSRIQKHSLMSFPRTGQFSGDSKVHLDNFLRDGPGEKGFRYDMSAIEVQKGSILFISGFASNTAMQQNQEGYVRRQKAIQEHPAVKGVVSKAKRMNGLASGSVELPTLHQTLDYASLHQGDIVFFPQGAGLSERPVWHAVIEHGDKNLQGHTSRETVSHHYVSS